MKNRKKIYVDMDDVLCDFMLAYRNDIRSNPNQPYPQSRVGFFMGLEPIKDAIYYFKELEKDFDMWFLTRPSIKNIHCYTEKAFWIREHFGEEYLEKLILSPNKSLLIGDYLIDDSTQAWQRDFTGEFIHFGVGDFKEWKNVYEYLIEKINN